MVDKNCAVARKLREAACFFYTPKDSSIRNSSNNNNKKAVLPQGNRAMPQVFFSVEVRQQHSLQV